jgi:hypothetical protein
MGSTQGERIERIPARNANNILPIVIAGFPSSDHLAGALKRFADTQQALLIAPRRETSPHTVRANRSEQSTATDFPLWSGEVRLLS